MYIIAFPGNRGLDGIWVHGLGGFRGGGTCSCFGKKSFVGGVRSYPPHEILPKVLGVSEGGGSGVVVVACVFLFGLFFFVCVVVCGVAYQCYHHCLRPRGGVGGRRVFLSR